MQVFATILFEAALQLSEGFSSVGWLRPPGHLTEEQRKVLRQVALTYRRQGGRGKAKTKPLMPP